MAVRDHDDDKDDGTTVVVIETSRAAVVGPSSGNRGGRCALVVGVVLALHTPAWMVLVFCREDVVAATTTTTSSSGGDGTTMTRTRTILLRLIARWLLDFTPWLANALLSVFLGVLFVCLGASEMEGSGQRNDDDDDDCGGGGEEKKKKKIKLPS